jgi:hypothetical protein
LANLTDGGDGVTGYTKYSSVDILEEWSKSNLTLTAFSKQHNMPIETFRHWVQKFRPDLVTPYTDQQTKQSIINQFHISGLSQRKFAEKIGIPRARLRSWLERQTNVRQTKGSTRKISCFKS